MYSYKPQVQINSIQFFFLINSFLAVLVLSRCARAFPSCCEWGALSVVVHRLLISVASLAAEHKL